MYDVALDKRVAVDVCMFFTEFFDDLHIVFLSLLILCHFLFFLFFFFFFVFIFFFQAEDGIRDKAT